MNTTNINYLLVLSWIWFLLRGLLLAILPICPFFQFVRSFSNALSSSFLSIFIFFLLSFFFLPSLNLSYFFLSCLFLPFLSGFLPILPFFFLIFSLFSSLHIPTPYSYLTFSAFSPSLPFTFPYLSFPFLLPHLSFFLSPFLSRSFTYFLPSFSNFLFHSFALSMIGFHSRPAI